MSCPTRYRPWSAEDDAALARHYAPRPDWEALARALPHRTRGAMVARAMVLDLERRQRPWTAAEDAAVQRAFGEVSAATLCARLPGRSWRAIRRRAAELGLGSAVPQGFVTLKEAAKVLCYSRGALRSILERRQVRTLRWAGKGATGRPRPGDGATKGGRVCRWLLVDLAAATLAVEEDLAAQNEVETIRGGAIRRGVDAGALRAELLRRGAYEKGARGGRRLLPSAVLDDAAQALEARAP